MAETFVEKETTEKVKLRFGVYENAGKEENLEKRFALAEEAANSVKTIRGSSADTTRIKNC